MCSFSCWIERIHSKCNYAWDTLNVSYQELKDINKNGYELIFNSLDRNKDGIVSIDEFLESISNRETNPELIERFLDKVNDNLLTTSEIMMIKIKKLKERATYSNDEESLNDLNW